MMDRRLFLRLLAGAGTVAAVAPKSYFFAPAGGWRSDVIINPDHMLVNPEYIPLLDPEFIALYKGWGVPWDQPVREALYRA